MGFWSSLLLVIGIFLAVGLLIGIKLGQILKLSRLYLEKAGVSRCARAIKKFINREQNGDVQFYIRQYDGAILSEEEAGKPDLCVICRECGYQESEDAREPLLVFDGSHVPLCEGHKGFVREFDGEIRHALSRMGEFDEPPSE